MSTELKCNYQEKWFVSKMSPESVFVIENPHQRPNRHEFDGSVFQNPNEFSFDRFFVFRLESTDQCPHFPFFSPTSPLPGQGIWGYSMGFLDCCGQVSHKTLPFSTGIATPWRWRRVWPTPRPKYNMLLRACSTTLAARCIISRDTVFFSLPFAF